ncbi:16S rRNA (guanine(527)-N(7))-methyltransferase RsmG [Ensifer soli]|uniref:16S rRNA (guanine(527)-N(7))-methyltransferase RsmG n=1 Tax=Ciceribacter sp. sgz301302 TaxID=3342379 RepID=UPI0035B8FF8D
MPSPAQEINGVRVSRETAERLSIFVSLFERWSAKINLIAPSTKASLWQRHVADSAQIFQLSPEPQTWVDLGSGGGFPGIITAIFLTEMGDGHVHLVESNNKKAAFLRSAIAETGARATVHAHRIESAVLDLPVPNAISARALADLATLLELSLPLFQRSPRCRGFFHKGRDYPSELDKAIGRFHFDLLEHRSVIESDSVILEISNVSRQPVRG